MNPPRYHSMRLRGFTLIEMLIVLGIIAVLAMLAMPANLAKNQRADVAEALRMTETIRQTITFYYTMKLAFPEDNLQAGVPQADLLIGNNVTRIDIENGAIHITLGNKVSKALQGKILTLRPAVVTGSPTSPISWLCGAEPPVAGMEVVGENKTDLMPGLIPASCGR